MFLNSTKKEGHARDYLLMIAGGRMQGLMEAFLTPGLADGPLGWRRFLTPGLADSPLGWRCFLTPGLADSPLGWRRFLTPGLADSPLGWRKERGNYE